MQTKRKPGRPKVAGGDGSSAIRIDRETLVLGDELVELLSRTIPGLRAQRADVLRSALRRGIEVMTAECESKN